MSSIFDCYQAPAVRRQMVRFLGGASLDRTSAAYLTASGPNHVQYDAKPVSHLRRYLGQGLDIGRSLWDERMLIAHFDIDYANFTFPGEAYLNPDRTFRVMRPVLDTAKGILQGHGLNVLWLLSGCGHHLVWAVRQGSDAFVRLAALGRVSRTLQDRYNAKHPLTGRAVSPDEGRAHAGLSMLLEYLSHEVIRRAAPVCPTPLEITAAEAGSGRCGAEVVSLDISEYADPLHLRTVRMPFSVYLKPRQRADVLGEHVVSQLPEMFLIPLDGSMSAAEGLAIRRDARRVAELAGNVETAIPDLSAATDDLIDAYLNSRLARFHAWFYDEEHEPPERWPATYDAVSVGDLPPCARRPMERPCDLMLQPGRIRHVVRVLLADGWHPRHIAGLIRSKYERDHGWGDYWLRYEASSRADFYTRVFAGLYQTGLDELVDFNCVSTQEKGYCSTDECSGRVDRARQVLVQRNRPHV